MDFKTYQKKANETDQSKIDGVEGVHIPLLGLAGETGTLLTEYKKRLRDGESHKLFPTQFKEELGDILWYVSNIAHKLDLDLEDIASSNLTKIKERWDTTHSGQISLIKNFFFDDHCDGEEQIPRKFEVYFKEISSGAKVQVKISMNKVNIGDALTDNSHEDDGYRYHDAFHFAFAAVLGWSPVVRSILRKKRKSHPKIDEVEDGARAAILEEAITAFVYNHAKNHDFYKEIKILDYDLLKTVKGLVSGLEVKICTLTEWQKAILEGYKIFNHLVKNNGGRISLDLSSREIKYLGKDD
jgi:NTP pyrophosphatase (non-canonical NTP hydrolase)